MLMSIFTSGSSGNTATVAAEVWMRPWASCLGDALHAMAAAFEAEMAIGAGAFDIGDHFLKAAAFAGGEVVDFELPPVGFAVFAIHLKQIADKDPGLVAARARSNLQEEGVDRIVFGRDEFVFQ